MNVKRGPYGGWRPTGGKGEQDRVLEGGHDHVLMKVA
jgi:hypothetical protein